MPFKSLIVDDESIARELLQGMLTKYCPETVVVGQARSIDETRVMIKKHHPDVVFLDIELADESGFDLIVDSSPHYQFQTVLVTAYKQYALRALKSGVVDYLLKPIDIDDLRNAVRKLERNPFQTWKTNTLSSLALEQTLLLPFLKGIKVVKMKEIVRLEADNNYTMLYFIDDTHFLVSKSLKYLEDCLEPSWFFKTHKSHIINLYHCREYSSRDYDCAVMADKSRVVIARSRLQEFLEVLRLRS